MRKESVPYEITVALARIPTHTLCKMDGIIQMGFTSYVRKSLPDSNPARHKAVQAANCMKWIGKRDWKYTRLSEPEEQINLILDKILSPNGNLEDPQKDQTLQNLRSQSPGESDPLKFSRAVMKNNLYQPKFCHDCPFVKSCAILGKQLKKRDAFLPLIDNDTNLPKI